MPQLYRLSSILIFFIALEASAASFDCQKARSNVEELICADPALSKSDEKLNSIYQNVLSAATDKSVVVQLQREWLKREVHICTESSCLKNAFSSRIAFLQTIGPKGTTTTKWNGTYHR